jgi:hypothetical protein
MENRTFFGYSNLVYVEDKFVGENTNAVITQAASDSSTKVDIEINAEQSK